MHFGCAGSQNLGASVCFPRLCSPCGAVLAFGLDGLAQEIGAVYFVASAALWTWLWSSARSDFIAGAVTRDL